MNKYILIALLLTACASSNHNNNPQVQNVLEMNMSLFEFCVSKYRGENSPPVDKIDLTFIISAQGKVANARIEHFAGNTPEDYLESSRTFESPINPATETCLIETLKKLSFPPLKEMNINKAKVQITRTLEFNNPE